MFGIISAMREFERALIVEGVKAGMRNARAKGSKIGRPRAKEFSISEVRNRIFLGEQRQDIAKSQGVSPALITKRLKAPDNAPKS